MTNSDFDRLEAFAQSSSPPVQTVKRKTVKPLNRGTMYWGAGLVGVAIVYTLIVKLVAGTSFIGDILFLGGMGLLFLGVLFGLSALGAYWYNGRAEGEKRSGPAWVAAIVRDRQFDAAGEGGTDFIFLELLDGRRVRLEPKGANAQAAQTGDIGWALYRGEILVDFAAE